VRGEREGVRERKGGGVKGRGERKEGVWYRRGGVW
jgi:hypothetical protein